MGGNFVGNSYVSVGGDATGNAFGAGSRVENRNITISGNVSNSQVGQTLTNCQNIINEQAPSEKKDLLEALEREVARLIAALPDDMKDKEAEIADDLKMVVEQATSATPNRKFYSVSAQGLLDASKWVKDFTGNIAGTVGQLGKLVLGA